MRKRELLQYLKETARHYQRNIRNINQDLKTLESVDMRKSTYVVYIEESVHDEDLCIHRPKRTTTKHIGSLTEAINAAEKNFAGELGVNLEELEDVRVRYSAQIKVGKRLYFVPEKIIDNVLEKRRSSK